MSVTANGRQETRRVHTIKTPGVHESMGMTESCLGDGGSEVVVGGCAISLVQTGGFYIGERGGTYYSQRILTGELHCPPSLQTTQIL